MEFPEVSSAAGVIACQAPKPGRFVVQFGYRGQGAPGPILRNHVTTRNRKPGPRKAEIRYIGILFSWTYDLQDNGTILIW